MCEEKGELVLTLESLLKEEMNRTEGLEMQLLALVTRPDCTIACQVEDDLNVSVDEGIQSDLQVLIAKLLSHHYTSDKHLFFFFFLINSDYYYISLGCVLAE